MTIDLHTLPPLSAQAERLIELGVHERAGLSAGDFRGAVAALTARHCSDSDASGEGALLVIHPDRAPASSLAPLLRRTGRPGFVVVDMTDVDAFSPIESVALPQTPVYLVADPRRGDELANWSPAEALPAITEAGRSPLTVAEGIGWLLQSPEVLQPNHCFMTIGSRLRRTNGSLDARIPAIWISGGTGRDGSQNRNAPKVGWCWAGNRHTWLGFASAIARVPVRAR